MPCNGTKDKEVMGKFKHPKLGGAVEQPEAEAQSCCDRNCWMIGLVSAMAKYIWVPAAWVIWAQM